MFASSSNALRLGVRLFIALTAVTAMFVLVYPCYNTAIVGISNAMISVVEDPRLTVLASDGARGQVLGYLAGRDNVLAEYNIGLQYELVLFFALLFATPRIRILKRLTLGLVGLIVLGLYHSTSLTIYARDVVVRGSGSIVPFLFIGVALAVLLWACLTFRYWLPWPTKHPADRSDNVGRNDPCPCGSGRKYKKCCDKAK